MDKYQLYHNIKSVQSIAEIYPEAKGIAHELNELAQQHSSRVYRVAVIGEFKRGKSSLINCILGTEILPTDILPTTAVVNRVVYGTEQRIDICYKDGNTVTTDIESLAAYATKKDALNAASIREIVVHYPSVFCQNSIELLDTPGLNDDEFMDKTTFDVLDKIDTAIVATHACYPLSQTEQNLICKLIEQEDIYHLTFVATFIDKVSDEAIEQDRIIDLIKSRLSGETFQMFCCMHRDEPELLKKAEKILSEPMVFAVSSRLAMRGFVSGNKQMLDESRFPHFKYELSALLTANQELHLQMKAARLIRNVKDNFEHWHKQYHNKLNADIVNINNTLQEAKIYQASGCVGLMDKLVQMENDLSGSLLFTKSKEEYSKSDFVKNATWSILKHMLQIEPKAAMDEDIKKALVNASQESSQVLCSKETREKINAYMYSINRYLLDNEKKMGLSEGRFTARLAGWRESHSFPISDGKQLDFVNIIFSDQMAPFDLRLVEEYIKTKNAEELVKVISMRVCENVYAEYLSYLEQIRAYIASWRVQILKQNLDDKNEMLSVISKCEAQIKNINLLQNSLSVNYTSNLALLEQIDKNMNFYISTNK